MEHPTPLRWPVLLLALCFQALPCLSVAPTDSVEISLLTCSPHHEVYALYGHTALRVCDHTTGEDIAVNYGVFSFDQPHFVTRFIFGLTDYQMGVCSFEQFCREYAMEGRSVVQQTLDLTADEKARIVAALIENARPENVVYRYNFFYDNCTTRVRDMVMSHIDGKVRISPIFEINPTFRSLTHEMNADYPWARFGNDILLGVRADRSTTQKEREFLPLRLQKDFSRARVDRKDGTRRPLVLREEVVVKGGPQVVEEGFPLRPRTCFLLLFASTLIITLAEFLLHRRMWVFDALLLVVCGLAGVVLMLMVFSQHPTVQINLQFFILNPLPLILAWPVVSRERKGKRHWWWQTWGVLCLVFFFYGFWQDYAEGMVFLALSLLLRCIVNYYFVHRAPTNTSKSELQGENGAIKLAL
ncbi:MAG: DUF4105 domain-containing protein [Prevotella sp.]|nr:DUF4105 domain-containing protein [Prevotella sp.]